MENITKFEVASYDGKAIVDLFVTSNHAEALTRAQARQSEDLDVFVSLYGANGEDLKSSPLRFHTKENQVIWPITPVEVWQRERAVLADSIRRR